MIDAIIASTLSSAAISPWMTILDVAILKTQIQQKPCIESISKSLNRFGWRLHIIMWTVYSGTYATKNAVTDLPSKTMAITSTTLVNTGLLLWKDMTYTSILKRVTIHPTPTVMAGFFLRDFITISSLFHQDHPILFVFMSQFLSTPIHILSVDKMDHAQRSWKERWQCVTKHYRNVLFGRLVRVIPAFCIGTWVNHTLYRSLRAP